MPILFSYLLRTFLPSYLLALLTATFVLNLVFYLQEFLEYLLVHAVGWSNSIRLLLYIQPSFLVLSLPIAFLAALLLTFGRLSTDREVTALESLGVPPWFLAVPVLAGAVVYSAFLVAFMDWTLPWGNTSFLKLQYRIISERSAVLLRERTFVHDFPGYVLYVGEKNPKIDTFRDVLVYLLNAEGSPERQAWAPRGRLLRDPENYHVILELEDGRFQQADTGAGDARLRDLAFETCRLDLDLRRPARGPVDFRTHRNMTLAELGVRLEMYRREGRSVPEAELEYHKKFALPFSALAFALVGLPLGVRSRAGAVGASCFAVALVVGYWLVLLYGETAAHRGGLPPALGAHLPNLILGAAGALLLGRLGRPGVRIRRGAALLAAGLLLGAGGAAAQTLEGKAPVDLKADRVEYRRTDGLVLAEGRVHLEQDGAHLFCERLRYDTATHVVRAEGDVLWLDGEQTLRAETLTYDTARRRGEALSVRTWSPPWYYSGPSVRLEPGKITLSDARFTTCDYPGGEEHYHLRAGKVTVRPGKSLSARDVRVYVGKVPVLYVPFFYRNLRDVRVPFSLDTGRTEFLGQYGLLTTRYLLSTEQYGSLYTDYFERRGFGFGIRHEAELSDYQTLSLYGYRVDSRGGDVRWETRARSLVALSPSLQGRAEAQWPGDGLFSRDFGAGRRDPFLVSTERQLDFSATWNRPAFTAGVLWRRRESSRTDPGAQGDFTRESQAAPRVDLTIYPRRLAGRDWLRWEARIDAERAWTRANGFYRTRASGETALNQNLRLLRSMSLFSRAAYRESWQDKSDAGTDNRGSARSFSLQDTWNARWTALFETRLTHRYERKLNRLTPSEEAEGGVLAHTLDGSVEFRAPGGGFRARTSTRYDLLADVDAPAKRFSLLRQEVYAAPSSRLGFFVTANYSLQAKELKDLNSVLDLRSRRDLWRFRLAASMVDPKVGALGLEPAAGERVVDLTADLSVVLFTNYQATLLEAYDVREARFRERSFALYRDLHDWEASLSYVQVRGGEKRVAFRLNLKAFPGRPLTISEEQLKRLTEFRRQSAGELVDSTADEFK